MNKRIDELFANALDKAVPETWMTLDYDQLQRVKEEFSVLLLREFAYDCIDITSADKHVEFVARSWGVDL
jgi:hypothetical protein